MGVRGSLARQLLVLQFAIVLALLGAVTAVTLVQSSDNFRETEARRMISIGEDVAARSLVRDGIPAQALHSSLAATGQTATDFAGVSYVIIADRNRRVLTSPDPRQLDTQLAIGESTVLSGRSWQGEFDGFVVAHVPVLSTAGEQIGFVAVGQRQPTAWESLMGSTGNLVITLGIAIAVGVAGSLLAAWWVKRQTLGLEPREITGLVEHREAMLHGIKEGVLGLDQQHRITLANDEALELLSLPDRCVGTRITELDINDRLVDVLTGMATGADQIVLRRGKVLIMNRMPIVVHGNSIGAVVTMRDRTELVALQRELDANRDTTDTLRAQAHEFTNELHTIAGLIELGEYDEVARYVTRANRSHERWSAEVSSKIDDPALAALLIAKASLAAERGVGLRIAPGARLDRVDDELSTDLVSVVGNLIDNALDALRGWTDQDTEPWVEVDLSRQADEITVQVRDSGPGVAPELADEVFRHGFTTKVATEGGTRGIGLALTRQICVRRGGEVAVRNEGGAVFTARMGVSRLSTGRGALK